jgi:hypothetical protein
MIDITIDEKALKQELNKDIETIAQKAVILTANYMETKAKEGLQRVVYQVAVPWVRTGKAQQSITMSTTSKLSAQVYIGVNYGKFIEYGTKAHTIYGKPILSWKSGGKRMYAKKVNHPGTKARPFWNPAIKLTKAKIPYIVSNIWKES